MRRAFLLTVFLALAAFPASCTRPAPEEAVREAVLEAERAAEAKDLAAFMDLVSADFSDDKGNSRDGVKAIALREFLRPGPIKVFLVGLDVELSEEDETALVETGAVVVRGKNAEGVTSIDDVLPRSAEALKFSMVWRKEDDRWRVLTATWERVGLAGLL